MRVHPIIAALRRHKAGVALIVLQVALTLAIVCNALFIIGQRIRRMERPTGVRENGLILVSQSWLDVPGGTGPAAMRQLDARQLADLHALRHLPGVMSVAATDSLPLAGMIWTGNIDLRPDQAHRTTEAALYYGDDRLLPTLGLHLVAGRNFTPGEIAHHTVRSAEVPPVVIITRALAHSLFGTGDALGRTIYVRHKPTRIIGVVARLQTPTALHFVDDYVYHSVIEPVRLDGTSADYAVRVSPGHEQAAMRRIRKALFTLDPLRMMPGSWGVQSFAQIRAKAYRADRGMAILMGAICVILLCMTAAGMVGLTSFWVLQRRRQIGVRRALGAQRSDILRYFLVENLFITGTGVLFGVLLAALLNGWLMHRYALPRLPLTWAMVGMVLMLALGQAAACVPARRAARVPPMVATRSVG